ncbi:MAG TPA: hypothetical protein VKU77_39310 [Streptosporangiaceae bacterium]|nr:hypothetical protein [Streptosporangiaceae bacterium]
MTSRRITPLFPAPLHGLDPARRADAYAGWLAAGAAGLTAETAAVTLLAEHGTWLERPSFTSRCIDIADDVPEQAGTSGYAAGIRWRAAITGISRHGATGTEQAILRIAASIAAGIPVSLHDCLGSLDTPALAAVLRAIAHANSGWRGHDLLCHGPVQDPPF